MAVDDLRDTFHINRVKTSELGLPLIAQAYRPEITEAVKQVKAWGKTAVLHEICAEPIRQGKSPVYADAGHPCVKTKNIAGLIVSKDEVDWVDLDSAQQLSRYFLADEDVLVNRSGAGSIGRTAIYFGHERHLTNEHVFRVRVGAPNDPAFICCFLSSWWGERAIEQGISGSTGQLNLANDHIRSLTVILPDSKVQTYIGDKVRQAERLRARARELEAQVKHQVAAYFGHYSPICLVRNYRLTSSLIQNRVDAWFYNPRFLHAQAAIQSVGGRLVPLGELAQLITNGATPLGATFGDGGVPWFRGKDFAYGDIAIEEASLMDRESEATIKRSRLEPGDVVLSIKGTVGDVAVIDEMLRGCNINQDVARIKLGNLEDAHFIASFFESSLGQVLIEQQVYGAVNAFFSLENLRQFVVPLPSSVDTTFKISIAQSRHLFILCRRLSKGLTATAKLLVEALIEGKLSEAELKEAQEALERGEHEADRAMLARLTRKGIDVAGEAPLFPDLDALYATLDQATAAATQNQHEEVSK